MALERTVFPRFIIHQGHPMELKVGSHMRCKICRPCEILSRRNSLSFDVLRVACNKEWPVGPIYLLNPRFYSVAEGRTARLLYSREQNNGTWDRYPPGAEPFLRRS
jgi:hypothetical protein